MALGKKEIFYVNGVVKDNETATINIEDRGYQFGEGVYEVIATYNGIPFALDPHLERLNNSARGIGIDLSWSKEHLEGIVLDLLKESGLESANIYIQVTSGTAPRSHLVNQQLEPNLIITIRNAKKADNSKGIKAATEEDIRWKKCWIKSTNLLPNIMAKKSARSKGCQEAIMYEQDERITEGASTNVFAVVDGVLITPSLEHNILPGVTRNIVMQIAEEKGIPFKENVLFINQLKKAEEIMVTSTTMEITPVVELDGEAVGQGVPGPVYSKLIECYQQKVQEQCK